MLANQTGLRFVSSTTVVVDLVQSREHMRDYERGTFIEGLPNSTYSYAHRIRCISNLILIGADTHLRTKIRAVSSGVVKYNQASVKFVSKAF